MSLTAAGEVLTVVVTAEGVRLTRDGKSRDVPRSSIAAAFVRHGYPWRASGAPYRDHYRRWADGAPELSAGANAVLRARARAVEKGDRDDDAAELRDELAKLGVVVRDRDKRQYWRPTGRPADRG